MYSYDCFICWQRRVWKYQNQCTLYHLDIEWWSFEHGTLRQTNIIFPTATFAFICSNIQATPAYGVYASQLIRYSRAISIIVLGLLITRRLPHQKFIVAKLRSSIQMFDDRHHALVTRYRICVTNDIICYRKHNFVIAFSFITYHRILNKSSTTGVMSSGAWSGYFSGTHGFTTRL